LIADKFTFSARENQILFNIGNSFGKPRKAFKEKDDNCKKALIFKTRFSGEAETTPDCSVKTSLTQ
jgi:hypothetical protein